jgi:CubicO group peptidase (beta-lactamase class C family)
MKKLLLTPFILLLITLNTLCGQVISAAQIDSLVEKVLVTFDVPGISVGIIKDDKIVHAKGYGVRSLRTNKRWMKTLYLASRRIAKLSLPQLWGCWWMKKN